MEDVLTSGLSAKLMRYLRIRVLGEASTSQKESNFLLDNKNSSAAAIRSRRHASETSLEPSRIPEEGITDDRWTEPDGLEEDNETHDGKTRVNDRSNPGKNRGLLRSRGKGRVNEGGVENEHALNSPGSGIRLGGQGQGQGQGRNFRDKSLVKSVELKRVADSKKLSGRVGGDLMIVERDDSDD